jgi:histidyl-tRNA synthetase
VVEKIKRVYERYGFVPIDTPVLEYLVTLVGTGGEEANKQLFRLESPEREPIAMRFDLTVPFARLIAQYPDRVKLPFRRYHIGPVFRADKPGPGRFRQFTQFDIDAAGSDSIAVDAEIVAAMCEVMREIGLRNRPESREYRVKINNRKLVDALVESCGIMEEVTRKHVLRVVDKLQKVGLEGVRAELGPGRVDESGDPIPGVELPASAITRILNFITITQPTRRATIASWRDQLPATAASQSALRDMEDMAEILEALGVDEGDAVFDPSLARGLDYYTGPVFEAILLNAPDVGSVMGGGRYDGLVKRFLATSIPATGVSIGLDRLLAGLKSAGKLEPVSTTVSAFVLTMPGVPQTELHKIATELRRADISTVVYFGSAKASIKEQLAFANSNGIRGVAVILGEDEWKTGKISVKDLRAGMDRRDIHDRKEYQKASRQGQDTRDRSELTKMVKEVLARTG